MFDALPPQEAELADSLRPRIEVVAQDSTKGRGVWGGIDVSHEGNLNPNLFVNTGIGGVDIRGFADAGYVATPQRRGLENVYGEGFGSLNIEGVPLRPSAHIQLSRYRNAEGEIDWSTTARLGADVPIELDPTKFMVRVYPLSTERNERGRMQAEIILEGSVNLGRGYSVNVMGRGFTNYRDWGLQGLGRVGIRKSWKWGRYLCGVEGRYYPTKRPEMTSLRNRPYLYSGCRLRF